MADFAARLAARVAQHGPLCVGIDPSKSALARCDLPHTAEGALEFGRRVLEAAEYRLAIVKPQSAYFERFGSAGVRALEELAALARAREVLVLLDAKRGDIDTTGEAYAEAFFAPSSTLRVDAVTLHPYLGLGALRKALAYAVRQGGGAFVVVRSSNPEGEALQTARLASGETVAEALCREITALNAELGAGGVGPVGAVVGATCRDAAEVVAALPRSYILTPGVGAQGATLEDVRARMPQALGRVLPNVSRAILAGGSSPDELRATIGSLKERARELLGRAGSSGNEGGVR
jgi:orotidine-5'-phosphate decarboxylase